MLFVIYVSMLRRLNENRYFFQIFLIRLFNPFQHVSNVLRDKGIIIFFPEGTRGEPEHLSRFKSGIAHLAHQFPEVSMTPVFLYGTGKALPKGEGLLVPFVVDVQIGDKLYWETDKRAFMANLEQQFSAFLAKPQSARDQLGEE